MFHFSKAKPSDIIKIIKELKSGTSVGTDNIPPKLVIMSAEVIANPLTKLTNTTVLEDLIFPMLKRMPQPHQCSKRKTDKSKQSIDQSVC